MADALPKHLKMYNYVLKPNKQCFFAPISTFSPVTAAPHAEKVTGKNLIEV